MFKFFKDKVKGVLGKFSKKVEEEAPEEEIKEEVIVEEKPEERPKEAGPPVEKKLEKPEKVEKPVLAEEPVEGPKEERPVKVEGEEKAGPERPEAVIPKPVKKEEEVAEKEPEKKPEAEKKAGLVEPEEVESEIAGAEKKGMFKRLFGKKPEEKVEEKIAAEERPEEVKVEEKGAEVAVEEKRGFFKKITQTVTTKRISEEKFDELFWDLEVALLESNVAVEVIEKIKEDLKDALVDKPLPRNRIAEVIQKSLHDSIEDLFITPDVDLVRLAKEKHPLVICFVGINGSGKTTSIAKVAKYLKDNGLSVVLAAADTFRAAAIDQLQVHADNLGMKLIRHDYGSDPAAVAFDAIKHAKSLDKDVVLIDTAGRLHSNINLMDEMKKIIRVADPDLKLFVGESITGNDCVEQAQKFDEAVGIDGIILSKADIDEKGGAAISVSYVTKKPILFLGMGQEYEDLEKFNKDKLIASMGV